MIKALAGRVATMVRPQWRFDRAVFLLGHMRCGSTALSHVLCGHPEISGYGEAHIRYSGAEALGVLALNQLRRRALRQDARYLFDKILHSRYDAGPDPDFFTARAVFLVREPIATIRSIRALFREVGSGEYATDALAANYYEERLAALLESWDGFQPGRRIGFTYDRLTADPEPALAGISAMLELNPPLANRYEPPAKAMARGAGDPTSSHRFSGIVGREKVNRPGDAPRPLAIAPSQSDRLAKLFNDVCNTVTQA